MVYVLLVIAIFLIVWYYTQIRHEKYRSCRECDNPGLAPNGTPVLNPFIWPHSGAGCIDDIYILQKDVGVEIGTGKGPLTNPSAPDHVVLTN
jgi:hypothetical protein